VWTWCPSRIWLCFIRSGYKYRLRGNVKRRINIKTNFYSYLHLFTFRRLRQFAYFSFFTSSHRFGELHRFSATFDDPRVPRKYLLAVTSGRIAVVRTKVLVSLSLSINRSNRLARFGYQFRVLALCVCRSTFVSTQANTPLTFTFKAVYFPCEFCLCSCGVALIFSRSCCGVVFAFRVLWCCIYTPHYLYFMATYILLIIYIRKAIYISHAVYIP
jgi:hypothetical protein